mmetsp:Transcript_9487/g.13246  ORF Transcript_9487/g.13246 Transcript_9487/m.13246 type:complete len:260 (-) Transcript_9487:306-1085(-)|eukprot:CAMPEP_0184478296 /NCGR_PEP_ID=MMETSP0113_2-20130426/364_1 /TAXON_ID=91329 /ORGANISM="Norrisiella sphaerica, Strain BC52" /LENGTH=259 /DNA_ID=CAMNT_0026856035 /DNA_START=146 /DNA_END=925 /DNA_ORIENTATION=+
MGSKLDYDEKLPLLPPQSKKHRGKLCVVLDMDETLLHSEFGEKNNNLRQYEDRPTVTSKEDFMLKVWYQGRYETIRSYMRPGLKTFLKKAAADFEVVVFTAALPVYANAALDYIDPTGELITHRLFRDACVESHGYAFVKDVSRLGRDLSKVVLVDNSPIAMAASAANAIPILSYFDNRKDRELPKLLATLYHLRMCRDVQDCLQNRFPGFRKQIDEFIGAAGKSDDEDSQSTFSGVSTNTEVIRDTLQTKKEEWIAVV